MSKYDLLRDHLRLIREDQYQTDFSEIEEILDFALPASAYKYPAWWSNEVVGNHVQKHAWYDAGFKTANLDLAKRQVTFVRSRDERMEALAKFESEEIQLDQFHTHEALHMSAAIMNMVERELLNAPAIIHSPEWYKQTQEIFDRVYKLYDSIGKVHLDREVR